MPNWRSWPAIRHSGREKRVSRSEMQQSVHYRAAPYPATSIMRSAFCRQLRPYLAGTASRIHTGSTSAAPSPSLSSSRALINDAG